MLYNIYVSVKTDTGDGFQKTVHLPTFILDSAIQGILDCDHAERIARDMFVKLGHRNEQIYVAAFVNTYS